ncbi:unnamed protein product [Schistosoma curassoni]|nr:unnamed protein product [Schistosoma curassoni]
MCKSCAGCVRVLMIVFNILFTIIGMIVLSAALYFYFSTFGVRGTDQHNILAYTYIVLAAIGALSFVLGILGCCGSYHYSRCLLGFYFALLLVIFAIEIAIGVAGFVHREQVSLNLYLNVYTLQKVLNINSVDVAHNGSVIRFAIIKL